MIKAEALLKEKKIIIYLIVGFIVFAVFALIVLAIFLFPQKKSENPEPLTPKEETIEEVLRNLTAPATPKANQASEEVIENLTAPGQKKLLEVPKEVIQGLTAPERNE